MDLKSLLALPLNKLRDEALKVEGLQGVHTMDRDAMIEALAGANEIKLPVGLVLSEAGRKLKPQVAKLKARRRKEAGDSKFVEARVTRSQLRRAVRKMRTAK